MALERLLSTVIDYAFFAGGEICDKLSTYSFVTREGGPHNEGNILLRYSISKEGTKKAMLKSAKNSLIGGLVYLGVTYSIDFLLGIEDNTLNLHHLFCYGAGAGKYWAALTNKMGDYGLRKTAHILQTPLRLHTFAMNRFMIYVGNRMSSKSRSVD